MKSWHRSLSLALMLSASLLGCDYLPKKKDKGSRSADPTTEIAKEAPKDSSAPVSLPGGAVPGQPGTPVPAPAAARDYFKDASALPALFKTARGCAECRALEVVVYPGFANAQLQDPKVPLNADQYTVRDGRVGDAVPISFHGDKPTEEGLRNQSFDLEKDVPWATIPKLVADTPTLLKIDGAQVSHINIKRNLPFSSEVRLVVFARGPRRSGWVEFDNAGKVIKVHD